MDRIIITMTTHDERTKGLPFNNNEQQTWQSAIGCTKVCAPNQIRVLIGVKI